MLRMRRLATAHREDGQALILFTAALTIFLAFVGMSVDVGRLMWAKGEMQSIVDSAALAGAQSMPIGTTEAQTYATAYWDSNKADIVQAGNDEKFTVEFPSGNRAIKVTAEADVPTWFLKLFGLDTWHVVATGKAESQVLDIALVLDISGSMCFTSYPPVEGDGPDWKGIVMGPGRASPGGSFVQPKLAANPYPANPTATKIPTGTSSSITIKLNSVSIFNTTDNSSRDSLFGDYWNTGSSTSGKKYHEIAPNGGRAGIIMIGNELFKITAVNSTANTLTVTRQQFNYVTDVNTTQAEHFAGDEVWANRSSSGSNGYCDVASRYARTSSTDGPHEPFDSALSNAQYFIGLFSAAYDKIGVVSYSSSATKVADLTGTSYSPLISAIDGIPYPNGGTNIAHGISRGRQVIDGTGKRANSIKIMVVLTDGVPTNYCSGATSTSTTYGYTSCGDASSSTPNTCPASTTAITHAINQASVAKSQDIIVYTIGLGNLVLDCTLQSIATAGGGTYYKAPTTAQLDDAFRAIAEKTHIGLTD
jgi:Flp pilus assembly protein TadG